MYNFELVASTLSFSASSISDLEKRSAWECFEKFRQIYPEPQNIQLAGPHRNLAMNRIDKGIRLSMNRTKANAIARQPRLEVRNHRYLNLFDAMRKSAKNREKNKVQGIHMISRVADFLKRNWWLRNRRIIFPRSQLSMFPLPWICRDSKQNEIVHSTRRS
jgi:hypothetical protein